MFVVVSDPEAADHRPQGTGGSAANQDPDGRRDAHLDLAECTALASKPISDLSLPLLRGLSLVPLQPGALAALTAGSFDKRLGMR